MLELKVGAEMQSEAGVGPDIERGAEPGYDYAVKKKPQKFPLHPKHPERICWGCDKYCPADSLLCGNGSGRTEHPCEVLGDDWYTWGDWGIDSETGKTVDTPT